jgi:hypothetical protein
LSILDRTHLGDGRDFVRACFNAVFDNDVPQELPLGDTEGAFFRVQLNVESPKVVEGFFQIKDETAPLSGFYHDVIEVDLEVTPYLLFEAKLHTPLICSPHVLQSEQHFYVAKIVERSDERGDGLVHFIEGYLVIS